MNLRVKQGLILIAALLSMLLTAYLGRWQLSRAAQKENLQATVLAQGALPLLNNTLLLQASDAQPLLHRKALLSGRWMPDATVYLDNRQMQGKVGFFVFTPLFMPKEGLVVWVQRGWVPRNFVNRTELPVIVTPSNLVQVHGRIAPPPSKLYEPGRAEEGTIRQNLNLDALTLVSGQAISLVILQQQGAASEGLQRDWPTFNSGVDKHYGYAAQWFGLSGLIAALYLWFQIVQPIYFRSKKASLHV